MRRLALLCLAVAACRQPPREDRSSFPPDIVMTGITLREYRGAALSLTARAPALSLYRETGALQAADAAVELHAEAVTVTVPRLAGNAFDGQLHGEGGVRLVSADGLEATAERVSYQQGVAAGDAGVRARRGDFTLEAREFRYELASQTATFEQVTTVTGGPGP